MKQFKALLSSSGSDVNCTILVNDLNVTFNKQGVGFYSFNGEFEDNKTQAFIQDTRNSASGKMGLQYCDDGDIELYTYDTSGALSDNCFVNTPVLITVE